MKRLNKFVKGIILSSSFLLASCGDFPDYQYDQSQNFCVMSFPFAGGFIGRQYIGYFRIISSLQYMDADPEYKIIMTGPSHIKIEPGSFQKMIIDGKTFVPEFKSSHLEGELQLWGPTFLFNAEKSTQILDLLREGHNMEMVGRLEIGKQYETAVYNFFFESAEEPFQKCVIRLLEEEDLLELGIKG